MNRKFIKVSLLTSATVLLFIAGCGPQDMNAAQDGDLGADQAMAPQGAPQGADQGMAPQGAPQGADQGMAPPQGAPQGADQGMAPQGAPQAPPPAEGGCPTGGCPAAAAGGCPTGNCEIPPNPDTANKVRLPDQHKAEPVKIIPTNERQVATDRIDYHTTTHVAQPTERHHHVIQHRHKQEVFHNTTVLHPTMRRINTVEATSSASTETTPTQVVVAPVVDYGCVAPQPEPAPEPAPAPRVVIQPVVRPVYYVQPVYSYFRPLYY